MTPETIAKLEQAFRYTFTDTEACLYAGIDESTFYRYERKHPEFRKRKMILRVSPNLVAKETLVSQLPGNLDQARWWAKNAPSMRQEFGEVQKVEHSGSIAASGDALHPEDEKVRLEYKERLKENIRRRAMERAQQKKDESSN